MYRLICLGIGYVCGLFHTSLVLGKWAGFDIRKHGSGNTGTTNVVRSMGWKMGMTVLAGDALKAVIPMLLLSVLFGKTCPVALIKGYTGLGTVLGHNYPFYTGFRGGKGIATSLGIGFGYHILIGALAMACYAIPFFTTHYASLSSLIMMVSLFGGLMVLAAFKHPLLFPGLSAPQGVELFFIFGLLLFMAFFRHRENLDKLRKGQERKTYLSGNPKAEGGKQSAP